MGIVSLVIDTEQRYRFQLELTTLCTDRVLTRERGATPVNEGNNPDHAQSRLTLQVKIVMFALPFDTHAERQCAPST